MAVTWFVTESFIGEIQTRAHHRQASNRSLSAAVKVWVCGLKKSKKTEKKACQPLAFSARPGIRATNRPVWPFKKKLKKVKKKLVSTLEIE